VRLNKITLKSCRKNINAALKQAGPRYTPALDKLAPNLQITKFENLFDSLFQKGKFIETIDILQKKAKEALKLYLFDNNNPLFSDQEKKDLSSGKNNLDSMLEILMKIRNNIGIFESIELNDILESIKTVQNKLYAISSNYRMKKRDDENDIQKTGKQGSSNKYDGVISSLRDITDVLNEFYTFLTEYGFDIFNKPFVLIYGEAGIGKTHTLCDLALRNLRKGAFSCITLAENLNIEGDILENIIKVNGYNLTKNSFLKQMSEWARKYKMRSLLIIDAINESSIQEWEKQLADLIKDISSYKGVGLILSCRTPYEKIVLTNVNKSLIAPIEHIGFRDVEFDAQQVFFKWKKVPAPEVPLMEDEFSNPLFLKLFTESLSFLHNKKHKSKELNSICSGQKGMTFILEQFYERVGGRFASVYSSKKDFCWLIAKEISDIMSIKQRDYINIQEFNDLRLLSQMTDAKKNALIKKCCSEGLFFKTCIYEGNNSWIEVIKFPYQRVSDHLIARSILKMELSGKNITEKKNALKQGFLGKIFNESNHGDFINLAEAIILEFPLRVENKYEIFDLLDWKKINYIYCESFLRGLAWRPLTYISKRTIKYINMLLRNQDLRFKTLDSVVALAVKNRRFNEKLNKWLFSMSLIERDLFWTEYLRYGFESKTIQKLLTWIENNRFNKSTRQYLLLYVDVLIWVLSSTNRSLRDRATRALVYLGQKNPELLLRNTIKSLNINDPYIIERMFFASYGTLMRMVHSKKGRKKIFKVNKLMPKIYKQMFCKKSKYSTTNILIRDAALGIIELMSKVFGKNKQINYSKLKEPFKNGGIRKWEKAEDKDEDKYRGGDYPLGMDFKNYTLGRLSPTRRNYDDGNNDEFLSNVVYGAKQRLLLTAAPPLFSDF
jgi:DNA replication protein DnaC